MFFILLALWTALLVISKDAVAQTTPASCNCQDCKYILSGPYAGAFERIYDQQSQERCTQGCFYREPYLGTEICMCDDGGTVLYDGCEEENEVLFTGLGSTKCTTYIGNPSGGDPFTDEPLFASNGPIAQLTLAIEKNQPNSSLGGAVSNLIATYGSQVSTPHGTCESRNTCADTVNCQLTQNGLISSVTVGRDSTRQLINFLRFSYADNAGSCESQSQPPNTILSTFQFENCSLAYIQGFSADVLNRISLCFDCPSN